jgi:DNA primase
MQIPEKTIDEISSKLSIVDVASDYLTLRKKGDRYWGLCPFHEEKTASFSVTPEKNLFYCFGCHKGGSIFTLIGELEHLTFVESVEFLARKAGISIEYTGGSVDRSKREALYELYSRVAGSFSYVLMEHPQAEDARTYLAERGILPELLEKYRLGYAPPDRRWLYKFLREKNYSDEFLAESGLFTRRDRTISFFANRVIFPILNAQGLTIAFGARAMDESGPKYLNSPDTEIFRKGTNLYGLHHAAKAIKEKNTFILAEGYFDVLAFAQAGIENAVAPLGTALTDRQVRFLRRYAEHGIIVFDADEAGERAAERAILLCEREAVACSISVPVGGKDPADLMKAGATEALQNLVKYPINSLDYLLNKAQNHAQSDTPEGKEAAVRSLFPYLESVESDIKREDCIRAIADTFGVSARSVASDFSKRGGNRSKGVSQPDAPNSMSLSQDLFLVLAVAANRHYFTYVRQVLEPTDIVDQRAREIFIALEDSFRRGEEGIDTLLLRIQTPDTARLVSERLSTDEFSTNEEKVIHDAVDRIKGRSYAQRRQDVVARLESLDRAGGNREEVQSLIAEKMYLDSELEKIRLGEHG